MQPYCKPIIDLKFTIGYNFFIMKNKAFIKISFAALLAAIICISGFIRIPVGPVPIVLQNVICLLAAAILGGFYGCIPTLIFLLAGLIGLPVYSGGTSGMAVWLGPTGGFLAGYFLGALATGLICGKPSVTEKKLSKTVIIKIIVAFIIGTVILYIPGIIHFARWSENAGKVAADKSVMAYTMACCVLPFIPGSIIKLVITIPVAIKLRPVAAQYLQ